MALEPSGNRWPQARHWWAKLRARRRWGGLAVGADDLGDDLLVVLRHEPEEAGGADDGHARARAAHGDALQQVLAALHAVALHLDADEVLLVDLAHRLLDELGLLLRREAAL